MVTQICCLSSWTSLEKIDFVQATDGNKNLVRRGSLGFNSQFVMGCRIRIQVSNEMGQLYITLRKDILYTNQTKPQTNFQFHANSAHPKHITQLSNGNQIAHHKGDTEAQQLPFLLFVLFTLAFE
jgi:hypothetical protein